MKCCKLLILWILAGYTILLRGQDMPVVVEAESVTAGADFTSANYGGVGYVSIQTALINAGNSGNSNRTISYSVIFQASGTYDLFVRLKVGPENFNDDSYFYANGFGAKNPAADADWIISNNLAVLGFSSNRIIY